MARLTPCPSCQQHVLTDERACPHCGAALRSSNARVPALLLGLALTGCPDNVEPVYGSPEDDGPIDETETETGMDTGTDETETTTVGEPEYGVPESG
jgi:hypothetical protein